MSEKTEKIKSALSVAKKHNFEIPAQLTAEVSGIETPQYRIAVVGMFQVGKSTLINHVFLSDKPLLLEGEGLCTTSVTTEIEYGESSRLELYKWTDETKTNDTLDQVIDNPSEADMKAATVGEDRINLANKISRVKIFANNESLKKYTILDTPGIDDPNPDILQNTTYRIIPGADLALVVTDARQLGQLEMGLLRQNLIKDGISKFMVLISYRPETGMTAQKREDIINVVKGQLSSIGQEDIPVEMYCFNESVDDILCSAGELSIRQNSFLADNALVGRENHIAVHLQKFLSACLVEIATKLKTSTQTAAENEALKQHVLDKKQDVAESAQKLADALEQDIDGLKKLSEGAVRVNISPIFHEYVMLLQKANTLKDVQNLLKDPDAHLKIKLSDAINACFGKVENDFQKILTRRQAAFNDITMSWDTFLEGSLGINGGILAKIPPLFWEIGNITLLNILLPGGAILATVGRMFQAILPILKNITIQTLVKTILIRKAEKEQDEARDAIIAAVCDQINDNLDEALVTIREKMLAHYDEQAELIIKNIGNSSQNNQQNLEEAKKEIEAALASLA